MACCHDPLDCVREFATKENKHCFAVSGDIRLESLEQRDIRGYFCCSGLPLQGLVAPNEVAVVARLTGHLDVLIELLLEALQQAVLEAVQKVLSCCNVTQCYLPV